MVADTTPFPGERRATRGPADCPGGDGGDHAGQQRVNAQLPAARGYPADDARSMAAVSSGRDTWRPTWPQSTGGTPSNRADNGACRCVGREGGALVPLDARASASLALPTQRQGSAPLLLLAECHAGPGLRLCRREDHPCRGRCRARFRAGPADAGAASCRARWPGRPRALLPFESWPPGRLPRGRESAGVLRARREGANHQCAARDPSRARYL